MKISIKSVVVKTIEFSYFCKTYFDVEFIGKKK
jgi:hypothetical protein